MTAGIPAIALIRALESEQQNRELVAGFKAMVRAYFNEYTDATDIDGESYTALSHWFNLCFYSGETDDDQDIDAIIAEVKAEMKR
jgi:hypothetical protein